jgi:hypothetical protein
MLAPDFLEPRVAQLVRQHLDGAVRAGDALGVVRLAHYLGIVHMWWQGQVSDAATVLEDTRVVAALGTLMARQECPRCNAAVEEDAAVDAAAHGGNCVCVQSFNEFRQVAVE